MIRNILWFDDDIASLRSTMRELQTKCNIRIDNAADVSTGLKKLTSSEYDLIIIDVIMPAGPIDDEFSFLNAHFESYQYNGGFGLLSVLFSSDWQRLCGKRPLPQLIVSSAYSRITEEQLIQSNLNSLKVVDRQEILGFLSGLITQADSVPSLSPSEVTSVASKDSGLSPGALEALRETLHEMERGNRDTLNHLSRATQFFYESESREMRAATVIARYVDLLSHFFDRIVDLGAESYLLDLYEESVKSIKAYAEQLGPKEVQFILGIMRRLIENPIRSKGLTLEMAQMQTELISRYYEFRDHCVLEIINSAKQIITDVLVKVNTELLETAVSSLAGINTANQNFKPWSSVTKVAKLMEPSALQRTVEFRYRPGDTDIEIYADKIKFEGIIANLLDNAIKYSGQLRNSLAHINIEQKVAHDHLFISVSNWGRPIDGEKKDLIKHGERGGKNERSGFGIGLAIVEQNVRLLGGTFSLKTARVGRHAEAVGRGPFAVNTFEARFPIRKVERIEHN